MRFILACCAIVALAACDKSKSPEPAGNTAPSSQPATPAGSQQQPTTAKADGVEIFVNDKSVAKVSSADLAKWPRLDALVPEADRRLGTWTAVAIKGKKSDELKHPSSTYPEKVPALYMKDQAPAFGMFDPVELANHGEPALRADGVTEIRIALSTEGRGGDHQGGGGGDEDPTKLVVTIKQAGKPDTKLTGPEILKLPREPMPGRDDNSGWRLTRLLEAAKVTKWENLVLFDASGTTLRLDKSDFDDKTVIPFVKLNKSAQLRVRVVKKVGEGWQNAQDLRALASIEIK